MFAAAATHAYQGESLPATGAVDLSTRDDLPKWALLCPVRSSTTVRSGRSFRGQLIRCGREVRR